MAVDVEKLDFEISARDKASEVFRGVSKTVADLQASYARFAALAGAGFVTTGLVKLTADAVSTRSALDDLADTTGDYVRTLDGLRRQAEISGVAFDSVGGALTKFARNLDSADDDGKSAAAAIKSIGLEIGTLNAMKPGEAMLEVARALGQFEDGAGKVRVAVALMGKEGASMLPYLKDLAESGELNGRITGEQAAEAERLEKQWRALIQTFRDGKEMLATIVIPEITKSLQQFQEGIRIFGGVGSAMYNVGFAIDPFKGMGENMAKVRAQIEDVQRLTRTPMGRARQEQFWALGPTEDTLRKRLEYLQFMERQRAISGASDSNLDARDLAARARPLLEFTPPGGNKASDVDSFIRSLQEEEIKKASLLRVTEVLALLETERYRKATAAERALAVDMARRIDLRRIEAESDKAMIDDETRGWKIIIEEKARFDKEASEQRQASERLALELQAVGGMSAGVAAGLKSADELEKMTQHWRDVIDPLAKYHRELENIAELEAMMYLSAEQAAAARQSVYLGMQRELGITNQVVKETTDWGRQMGMTFTSAFEDAIVKGNDYRLVLAGIGQDVARLAMRESVTKPLGEGVSGFFNRAFGNLFGGGSAASGMSSTQLYGFANGGDFTVGGSGGTDSQLVQFRATPGEMVSVRTPGQAAGGGDTWYIDARGADSAGLARLEATITALNGSIERRAVSAVMDAKLRGGAAARVLA